MYTYKTVLLPATMLVNKNASGEMATSFDRTLNAMAQDGWELVSMDTVTEVQKKGCIAALLGLPAQTTDYKCMVFKK